MFLQVLVYNLPFPHELLCMSLQEEGIRREWYQMRAEERLRAEGRLVDGEAAPADILAQVMYGLRGCRCKIF